MNILQLIPFAVLYWLYCTLFAVLYVLNMNLSKMSKIKMNCFQSYDIGQVYYCEREKVVILLRYAFIDILLN